MLQTLLYIPNKVGQATIHYINEAGSMFMFMCEGLWLMFTGKRQLPKFLHQLYFIGSKSLFVISLIGIFTGMVLGLQGYYTLVQFGSEGLLGAAVALTLIRELGPVLTAIMVTGRAGSAIAAEIGVMRITDQIDALEVMDINPKGYLVAPRFSAAFIAFPLLTALFNVIGIIGGYITGVILLGINQGIYFAKIESSVHMKDISDGFLKSIVFALIVATISCYQGYYTHKRTDSIGPEAVSNATTSAVVISCVMILIADYVITSFTL
ncbi:MlaE family ABC transporter permease [Desulfovibrio litoralis]|uniref:Phospholipid/cholesterol/gamma-HCH transport system permease protein n=1 Tax=Desulfovibrio litoralis DSM 11393 TaxID=1121455 RepID=A0A1M7S6R6_9BACT|nr:ABC transporter permease [Desulfovibrio litoralis]SHN54074.1 phospholipid/cholesterol/gamma-HCH transport system permease protein [Desulfovibrio litoralis DSM 11393]